MKIEYFWEIGAWQEAKELTKKIYQISDNTKFVKDFALKDQIRRAVVSVMANIAEGFNRGSNRDFARYLMVARSSNSEVQSHLFIALDLKYILKEDFDGLFEHSRRIDKAINAFIKYLKSC